MIDLDKATKIALNHARNYVPIRSGKLRYKFIKRGDHSITIQITGFNYPNYIAEHHFHISKPALVSGITDTYGWDKRFEDEFANSLAKALGGTLR